MTQDSKVSFDSPESLINAISQGEMVILLDDEDRENEGDLIMAAELVTPEAINFMATYGRGLICLPMTKARCQQLNLPLMVDRNHDQFSTNFTISIEAATGVTTGISAADRATTILAAVAKDATSSDIVRPGHIFPLEAKEGGVLTRAGHTEAGCDLARLAGLEPAAVIVEILNTDGSMARRDDLVVFAATHQLKIGTIADLIEYRNLNETTIERIAECRLPTKFGEFELVTYQDTVDQQLHFALRRGEIDTNQPTLVRVHLQNIFSDLLLSSRGINRSYSLHRAMEKIYEEGGVLVILSHCVPREEVVAQVKAFELEDNQQQLPHAAWKGTSRNVGIGSQILSDLGVSKMRLMSTPKQYHALSGFGLEIVEYVSCC